MQRIVPCLWFNDNAEEAVRFYTSLFESSHTEQVLYYSHVGQKIHGHASGTVMSIDFKLANYRITALNGGPDFQFTPAISLTVALETPQKVDALWYKLLEGGSILMPLGAYPFNERYGWLRDKFGLTWQLSVGPPDPVTHQIIVPSLLFTGDQNGHAEAALQELVAIFPNSRIATATHYETDTDTTHDAFAGKLMYGLAYLENEPIKAMDSPMPHGFSFTPAISLQILCDTQTEIGHYWHALSADPEFEQCGWLKDRHGISWQVVPRILQDLLADPDLKKSGAAMQTMLSMKKLDIAPLVAAYDNAGQATHRPQTPDTYI